MIIINLKGGLGNQMFQYALGRKLSLQNNDVFKIDTSGLESAKKVGDVYRPLTIDKFNIEKNIASNEEVNRLKYPYGFLSRWWHFIAQKLLRQYHVGWEPWVLRESKDMYLDGYWQSYKYFHDIRETILSDFTLVTPLSDAAQSIANEMAENNSVSILIRRGDYVSNPKANAVHGTCSISYFEKSIKHIQDHVDKPKWFVFSDDIEWVRENLPLHGGYVFCSGPEIVDYEQLTLMSLCKHNIIANSSFGWWGAWLNRNPKKVVVAPTPWFNTHIDRHKDLIPETWKKLPRNT